MNETEKYLRKLIDEMPQPGRDLQLTVENANEGQGRKRKLPAKYVLAASCLLLLGISIPAAARIPYVSERMQTLTKEDITSLSDMTQQQNTEADLFSRPFSAQERIRSKALRKEYENGIFPEGEILIVSGTGEVDAEFYYNSDTGMFYLPDSRELTDEELRQYIDFYYKRDYSLRVQHTSGEEAEDIRIDEPTDNFNIPDLHKGIIRDWLKVYEIEDAGLANLKIERILRPSEDFYNYIYVYTASDKTLRIQVSENKESAFLYRMAEESSEEVVSGTTIPKMEPLAQTWRFMSVKKALEEMDNVDGGITRAWYLCQSDAEGYLRYHAFGYLFTNDDGQGWVFIYQNGSAYPVEIMPITYDAWKTAGKHWEEYEEAKGIKFDHNVIALDMETGMEMD